MMTRSPLMASSSMSPLSRPAGPAGKPDDPHPARTADAVVSSVAANTPPTYASIPVAATPPKAQPDDDDDDDDDNDKDKDKGKGKGKGKGKAEEDKDDDKDDDKSKAIAAGNDDAGDRTHQQIDVARHARECERGRLLSILESEAGRAAFATNPEKVLRFALTYPGTRQEAIATLELFGSNLSASTTARAPLRTRVADERIPEIGPDVAGGGNSADPTKAMADAIVAAGRRRRGEAA